MRIFLCSFFLCVLALAASSPDSWLAAIRAKENSIKEELHKIRVASYKSPKKAALKKSLKPLRSQLRKLKLEIDAKGEEKFEKDASDQWLNVLQQARSLQSWNEESVTDIEQALQGKKSF